MLDEKDIEIARLKGEVAALERILASMRIERNQIAALPQAPPPPQQPWQIRGHGGMCACPQCCPPLLYGTVTTIGPQLGANAGCATAMLGGTVWIGETVGQPGPLADLCAPGVPIQAFPPGMIAPDGLRVGTH